jgi:hypothetical protein
MNSSTFFKNAPKYISQRFSAINSYTWTSFFPENSLNERLKKFPKSQESKAELARIRDVVNEASIVIFIFLMKRFFLDGTNAAIQAVDTFKELGIRSFQIGSKKFADRNKNVMKGEELAAQLMNSIMSEDLKKLINESQYVTQIIEKYKPLIDS